MTNGRFEEELEFLEARIRNYRFAAIKPCSQQRAVQTWLVTLARLQNSLSTGSDFTATSPSSPTS